MNKKVVRNNVKIAIMQPYFFPYIGYYQLIHQVDVLIFTDDYKYSKNNWINRNRIIQNKEVKYLTIPLDKASDYSNISKRTLASSYSHVKTMDTLKNAYQAKNYYSEVYEVIEQIILNKEKNLYRYLENSLKKLLFNFNIEKEIMKTSDFSLNLGLTGEEKIIKICRKIGATTYVNLPGGKLLYNKLKFAEQGIDLKFIAPKIISYQQEKGNFIPNLSVLDMLFNVGFNSVNREHLPNYIVE